MSSVKSLASLLLVFLIQVTVLAQNENCPAIVKNALAAADTSCAQTGRNEACYGNIILTAEAQSGVQDLAFEKAGDRASVSEIKSLTLSGMDTANHVWGIALLRVQANLPDTLPGQNVTFLMFGNVNITNAQTGDSPNTPTALPPVTVIIRTAMNLRSGSSTNDSIVSKLSSGQNLTADGRNATGDWLHVQTANGESGWVFAQLVTIDGDPSLLPVIDSPTPDSASSAPQYGPMQAFYFRTGGNDAPCAEAPDSGILIQTPKGAAHIDLLVNEVEINLGSTVYLQAQPNADMTIYVVEGQAVVTAQGTTVIAPAGTKVSIPMDADLHANGAPGVSQPYDTAKVQALPVTYLPDSITIAAPLIVTPEATSSANAAGDELLISGDWCPTKTGCTATVLPTHIQFTYENDGAVLILAYGGGEERYTRTEVNVYTWSQNGSSATLRVLSSSHFTQDFTFPGGNKSSADWTLQTEQARAPGS